MKSSVIFLVLCLAAHCNAQNLLKKDAWKTYTGNLLNNVAFQDVSVAESQGAHLLGFEISTTTAIKQIRVDVFGSTANQAPVAEAFAAVQAPTASGARYKATVSVTASAPFSKVRVTWATTTSSINLSSRANLDGGANSWGWESTANVQSATQPSGDDFWLLRGTVAMTMKFQESAEQYNAQKAFLVAALAKSTGLGTSSFTEVSVTEGPVVTYFVKVANGIEEAETTRSILENRFLSGALRSELTTYAKLTLEDMVLSKYSKTASLSCKTCPRTCSVHSGTQFEATGTSCQGFAAGDSCCKDRAGGVFSCPKTTTCCDTLCCAPGTKCHQCEAGVFKCLRDKPFNLV